MADRDHLTSNPPAQTATPQGEQAKPPASHDHTDSGGEGNLTLWYGRIVDATFPQV